MNKREDDYSNSARYYATPQEQKILIQGLQRYFSLPERSQNRNKVAKEVSTFLCMFSPHWTHRAVRLWFNNNRHTYLPMINDQTMLPQPILNQNPSQAQNVEDAPTHQYTINPPETIQYQNSRLIVNNTSNINNFSHNYINNNNNSSSSINNQISINNAFTNSNNNELVNSRLNSIVMPITNNTMNNKLVDNRLIESKAIRNSENDNKTVHSFPYLQQIQPQAMQVNPPLQFSQILTLQPSSSPTPTVTNQPYKETVSPIIGVPYQPQNEKLNIPSSLPLLQTQTLPDIQQTQLNQQWQNKQNELTQDQAYVPIAAALNEIRKLYRDDRDDSRIPKQVKEFDKKCMQTVAKYGSIPPDRIEPMTKYIRFSFPKNDTTINSFPDSSSSIDIGELVMRSTSFGQQLGSQSDITKELLWDQVTPTSIWQQKQYLDETVAYYEASTLTYESFAYASLKFGATQRTLSIKEYNHPNSPMRSYAVETSHPIDSLCMDNDNAWILSQNSVIRITTSQNLPQKTTNLDFTFDGSTGIISQFNQGAVIVYPTKSSLFFINTDCSIVTMNTEFSGFTDICDFGDQILCANTNSPTVRLITTDGREICSFVGHCGQVMGVEKLSENLFASRGADETVRIWDYRDPCMISTITTPHIPALCLSGSDSFVICGYSNKTVCVTDLRKDRGRPYLGVTTQDYNAISLKFNPQNDSLAMFGQVEKDTTKDSMMFVDNNGQNRQRIIRYFTNFTGVCE